MNESMVFKNSGALRLLRCAQLRSGTARLILLLILPGIAPPAALAQARLKTMPGYAQYQKMSREITNAVKLGSLSVTWKEEGKAFEYQKDGKRYRYDIAARKTVELPAAPAATPRPARAAETGERSRRPARGRQF